MTLARPPRARRPVVRFPSALERQYASRLLRRLRVARRLLLAALPARRADADNNLLPSNFGGGSPASPPTATVSAVHQAFQVALPVEVDSLLPTAKAIDAFATGQTVRQVETLVAVDLEGDTRITGTRAEQRSLHLQWARENVGLITTMEADTFDDLAKHVAEAVVEGKTDLAKTIEARFGVAESRARLIARDQVAKLNGRITQARQTALGISSYEWSTSGDERVRPKHRALDGKILRWDHPHPTEGHPGSAIACRCVAIAVVEDLEPPAPEPEPWIPTIPPPAAPKLVVPPQAPALPGTIFVPVAPPKWIPPIPLPTFPAKPLGQPLPAPGGLYEPLRPPPPALSPAENILHERLEGPSGSNPGGVYRGADGVKRYVKFYQDPAQAQGEHLANELYRELGFDAPTSQAFTDQAGRPAYASVIVEGTQTLKAAGITPARAKKVLDGFASDVLLANWDAVGLEHDNILVGARNKLLRVDNGGALLMRAKAGRKPKELLDKIPEWTGFLETYKNPAYAKVAQAAGITRAEDIPGIATQLRKIVATRKRLGGWDALVARAAPDLQGPDRAAIVDMLERRTDRLAEKLKEIEQAARRAKKLASGAPDRVKELLARNYRSLPHDAAVAHGKVLAAARRPFQGQERATANAYTGSTYQHINARLRAGHTPPEVPALDGAVSRGSLTEDIIVHRGVHEHDFLRGLDTGKVQAGDIFVDKAYSSTSLDKDRAFTGKYKLQIRAPAGSEGLWVGDLSQHRSELEVLLPRESQFYIVAAKKDASGRWVVECLLIPKK